MTARPRIVVTLDTGTTTRRDVPFPTVHTKLAYAKAVEAAGGLPLFAATTPTPDAVEAWINLADGLVVTGGDFDIHPHLYGASQTGRLDTPKPGRTHFEAALIRGALDRGRPILGVCGGMQLLNVVLGGTLIQDISAHHPEALEHEQPTSPAEPHHEVTLTGPLAERLDTSSLPANSTHHQAVDRLGTGLEAWGRTSDGMIEAIGLADRPEVLGVQWHPELLEDPANRALYRLLIEAAQ